MPFDLEEMGRSTVTMPPEYKVEFLEEGGFEGAIWNGDSDCEEPDNDFPDLDFEVFHGASSPMKLFEVVKRVKEICVIAERLSFT